MVKELSDKERKEAFEKIYNRSNDLHFYRKALAECIPMSAQSETDFNERSKILDEFDKDLDENWNDLSHLKSKMAELDISDYLYLKDAHDQRGWLCRSDDYFDFNKDARPLLKKDNLSPRKYDQYVRNLVFFGGK